MRAADRLHIHEMPRDGRDARDKTFLARLRIRRRVALGRGAACRGAVRRVAARPAGGGGRPAVAPPRLPWAPNHVTRPYRQSLDFL